jgi:hypothetical protein
MTFADKVLTQNRPESIRQDVSLPRRQRYGNTCVLSPFWAGRLTGMGQASSLPGRAFWTTRKYYVWPTGMAWTAGGPRTRG